MRLDDRFTLNIPAVMDAPAAMYMPKAISMSLMDSNRWVNARRSLKVMPS